MLIRREIIDLMPAQAKQGGNDQEFYRLRFEDLITDYGAQSVYRIIQYLRQHTQCDNLNDIEIALLWSVCTWIDETDFAFEEGVAGFAELVAAITFSTPEIQTKRKWITTLFSVEGTEDAFLPLPVDLLEYAGWKEDDELVIAVDGDQIIIRKV